MPGISLHLPDFLVVGCGHMTKFQPMACKQKNYGSSGTLFFFNLCMYVCMYGFVGSSFLCEGFL